MIIKPEIYFSSYAFLCQQSLLALVRDLSDEVELIEYIVRFSLKQNVLIKSNGKDNKAQNQYI